MPALVLPVNAAAAWEWANGRLSDGQLLANSNLQTHQAEALFIAALQGRWAWRDLVHQVNAWPGALALIFRTRNATVAGWIPRYGGEVISIEEGGFERVWAGSDATRRFLADRAKFRKA